MQEERSILSGDLMNLARRWIQQESEIFVVARLSHSANKKYYFFNNFDRYESTIIKLPPMADVCIFRKTQLATRALADKKLADTIKLQWPREEEWMIAKLAYNEPLTCDFWYEDENDLEESFREFRNKLVAVGPLPAWWANDNAEMQSGLIPLPDGTLKRGVY